MNVSFLTLSLVFGLLLIACRPQVQKGDFNTASNATKATAHCTQLAHEYEHELRLEAPTNGAQRELEFHENYHSGNNACYLEQTVVARTDFLRQRTREVFDAPNKKLIVGCFQTSYSGPPAAISCRSGLQGPFLKPADAKQIMDNLMSRVENWP